MAIDTSDADFDPQDQAEVFDEDNYSLDGSGDASAEMMTLEELPEVYDVTTALGDRDVDDVLTAEDADEIDEEELQALGDDLDYDDEAEDDRLDDGVEDEPYDNELLADDDADPDAADGVLGPEYADAPLEYVESTDEALLSTNAGRAAQHLESRGQLSNEDLEELGYRDEEGPK
jgi:hypothetical protein